MDPLADVHDIGDQCANWYDHCHSHGVDEPIPPEGAYLVCAECWHLYATPADLLAAEAVFTARANSWFGPDDPLPLEPETDPEKITFCPHCAHDF